MRNFIFGHNVFKSRLLLLRQNASAGGKGLIYSKEFLSIALGEYNFANTIMVCAYVVPVVKTNILKRYTRIH